MTTRRRLAAAVLLIAASLAASLAAAADAPPATHPATQPTATRAVAVIAPAASAATRPADQHVTGTVTFTVDGDHLAFVADVDGLAPNTVHGFHIHEKGDLSDPALAGAGGHYNPTHQPHGGPTSEHHHAGDLGNLAADDHGHAHLEGTAMHVTLGGENSILGRSVIIHARADDLHSQPSGDSGGRVAGGVIEAAAR